MTLNEVMQALEAFGDPQTKKTLMNHGAREPFFGVKVSDLKLIQKKIKKNYQLSKELFDTGNSDAMYLAGLIAEPSKMTKDDLNNWLKKAYWYYLSEFTIPWVTSESRFGWDLAAQWINSENETEQAAGWASYSALLTITPDNDIDLVLLEKLINRIITEIGNSPNRTRYTMNSFIISAGTSVKPIHSKAAEAAERIGKVDVYLGKTACKVPYARDYIKKIEDKNQIGKKRKTSFC